MFREAERTLSKAKSEQGYAAKIEGWFFKVTQHISGRLEDCLLRSLRMKYGHGGTS